MLPIAASAFALVLACGASTPPEPFQVDLDFGTSTTTVASLALAEAARVWAPYQVSVQQGGAVSADRIVVRVTIGDRTPSNAGDPRAIGSIEFRDGLPVPEIRLFEQRAWELICTIAGTAAEHWPISYREAMLGRVLGRALAHELGHYLLHSRQHSGAGLMRAAPPIADLMAAARANLFLTPEDLQALARVHAAGGM